MLKKVSAALITSMLLCGIAQAGNPVLDVNNQITGSVGAHELVYHELDTSKITTGPYLDSETGTQPGINLGYVSQSKAFGISNVYFSTELNYAKGTTAYDGYLMGSGKLVPFKNTTDDTTTNLSARLGRGFTFDIVPDLQVTPFVGVAQQTWVRSMRGQYGYQETYSHANFEIGTLVQFAVTDKLVAGADASFGRSFSSKMKTSGYDTFKLGSDATNSLGVSLDYAVTPKVHAKAGFKTTSFKYGQSPSQAGVLEPSSESTIREINFGAGYAF